MARAQFCSYVITGFTTNKTLTGLYNTRSTYLSVPDPAPTPPALDFCSKRNSAIKGWHFNLDDFMSQRSALRVKSSSFFFLSLFFLSSCFFSFIYSRWNFKVPSKCSSDFVRIVVFLQKCACHTQAIKQPHCDFLGCSDAGWTTRPALLQV